MWASRFPRLLPPIRRGAMAPKPPGGPQPPQVVRPPPLQTLIPDPHSTSVMAIRPGQMFGWGWGAGGGAQRGRLWTACGQARGQQIQSNDPRNNQHNPQYANYWAPLTRKRHIPPHPAQPPAHQRLGSANAETTPAGAPAAAADRTQRPDATCKGKNG